MIAHIIGGGLAGLSAAIELQKNGKNVRLYEAAKQAGGRCRSYLDKELNCCVDNGNHLIVSANKAVMAYLSDIQAMDRLYPGQPVFPFFDLSDHQYWMLKAEGKGLGAAIKAMRAIPGFSWLDILSLVKLALKGEHSVGKGSSPFFRRFLSPLVIAALNTEPETASAKLTWRIIRDTFGAGEVIPYFAKAGLGDALIDPALSRLQSNGAEIFFGERLRQLELQQNAVHFLHFAGNKIVIGPEDRIILAVPAWVAQELLPGIMMPDQYRSIVNIHYAGEHSYPYPFLGLVGGLAEWVFFKPGHLSVTISAADHCVDWEAEKLARRCWQDLRKVLKLGDMPAFRVVKEKRATFAATPAQLKKRPGADIGVKNLSLAGDWTETGWPATIEGAILSGKKAALRVLSAKG